MNNPTHFPENERHFLLQGPVGALECLTQSVQEPKGVGIICHPHPLHQGTMNNKVVYTIARAFHHKGLNTVRFNYRGVGKSEGNFGHSIGEAEDLTAVIRWVQAVLPDAKLWLAGFSFGAYIAAKGASEHGCEQLFSVAPAVHHQPYEDLLGIHCPWIVIQGTQDDVIPSEKVKAWFQGRQLKVSSPMTWIEMEASHFFHGKLTLLRESISDNLIV